jgi:hypothetical protein
MPVTRFLVLTTIGSAIWNCALIGAGWALGRNSGRTSARSIERFQTLVIVVSVSACRRRDLPPAPPAPRRRRRGGVVAGVLRALGLGLLHGPAELLPISSSAHAALLTQDLDGERRKELEVALHAGTLAAIGLPRPSVWLAVATVPPAIAGALFEKPIERRLGTPSPPPPASSPAGSRWPSPTKTRGRSPFFHRGVKERAPSRMFRRRWCLGSRRLRRWCPGCRGHGAALTAAAGHGLRAPARARDQPGGVEAGAARRDGAQGRAGGAAGRGPGALAAAAAGSALSTRVAAKALEGRGVRAALWPFALYRAALAASVRGMARQPVPVSGRVIAITGGARGIGRALATELQRRGAKVAIGDIDADAVEQTGRELGVLAGRST